MEYPLGDELLVCPPGIETAHALNPSARAIWDLCDGTRTVAEISRALGDHLGRPGEELEPDIRRALVQLKALGLLETV